MRTSRLGRVPGVLMAVLLLQACSNEQEAAEATAPPDGSENAQANVAPESATPTVVAEEAEARLTLREEPVLNYGERQHYLEWDGGNVWDTPSVLQLLALQRLAPAKPESGCIRPGSTCGARGLSVEARRFARHRGPQMGHSASRRRRPAASPQLLVWRKAS